VVLTSSPLIDRDKKFVGAVLVIRDITRVTDLERELRERHKFHNIIGKSSKMQEIYRLLEDLADTDTTVLITGESGTGKELVGRALHYSGIRALKPLITVNCSALAENLLESELFGHIKGAFTGAIRDKVGRFQAADGGTILLDEIGDLSPRIQVKLLRVLEEKEFERVGDSTPIQVDVRVIASTNRNLREMVRLGKFREDLYYRLKVVEINLPPLRERREDIPLLADYFCNLFNKKFKKRIDGISDKVLRLFMQYPWPGNVRELEHAIEHAFVLCHGRTIMVDDLPSEIKEYSYSRIESPLPEDHAVDDSQEILRALNKTDWNKAKAARLLGVSRQTIYRKIEEYKLTKPTE
jgi:transcriptional regulator with PAS, ATPase and Fis domain